MSKFTDVLGFQPTTYTPKRPTEAQIAATGRALPEGRHKLTEAQQRAWFGWAPFDAPVAWEDGAFVSGDRRLTPRQIAQGGT